MQKAFYIRAFHRFFPVLLLTLLIVCLYDKANKHRWSGERSFSTARSMDASVGNKNGLYSILSGSWVIRHPCMVLNIISSTLINSSPHSEERLYRKIQVFVINCSLLLRFDELASVNDKKLVFFVFFVCSILYGTIDGCFCGKRKWIVLYTQWVMSNKRSMHTKDGSRSEEPSFV